ncbi:hypothetical protein IFM89_023480 [Coptis chinensis]|uniref:HD domain-containing protein n=1 Tax=Coptis chinensis TaxID=261450 RepID=A0A835HN01_9MAGN|nr:hypothetical protein IFM89_023480 [Coptis chinensis]
MDESSSLPCTKRIGKGHILAHAIVELVTICTGQSIPAPTGCAKEISELWMEYEENSSPEAKVVKDFDKVEMILQALEYENEQGKDLDEFFQSTAGVGCGLVVDVIIPNMLTDTPWKFQTDVGKAWALEIASRRSKKN